MKVYCLLSVQGYIAAFPKKKKKKLALMSFFFLFEWHFSPPHLPPSLPFGHIAYKSQAILVSGLPKAWPPGKAYRTAVKCLIRTLKLFSVYLCLCIKLYPHPFMQLSILFFCSYTVLEQVLYAVYLSHHMLAVAFVDWRIYHFAFPHHFTFWFTFTPGFIKRFIADQLCLYDSWQLFWFVT